MKLGFIGCGNMASAMIAGIIENKICVKDEIICSTKTVESGQRVSKRFGVVTTLDNKEVAGRAEIIFLAVKPFFYEEVIEEIKEVVTKDKIIVTVAPGKTLAWLEEQFGEGIKCIRTMPNTPAQVLEGVTSVTPNTHVSELEVKEICRILGGFGKAIILEERLIDSVIVASGSSPAFVYMFIEALADAAVAEGMPREMAYQFVSQSVLGSAKMVLETGKHPGELKDMVCSPLGATIAGVAELEKSAFRGTVIAAAKACANRGKDA